jgi:hypothetical protein
MVLEGTVLYDVDVDVGDMVLESIRLSFIGRAWIIGRAGSSNAKKVIIAAAR